MHVRRGFVNWGVFLICLGAIPLAVQLNVIDRGMATSLLRLWPLILIGIGLGLLLRFSRAQALGGFVVAGTFGVLIGVFFAGGLPTGVVCPDQPAGGTAITRSGTFGTVARLDFEFSCSDVSLNNTSVDPTLADNWSVSVNAGSRTPDIGNTDSSLELRSADTSGFAPFSDRVRENWQVTLPGSVAMSVSGTFNAATSTLALGSGLVDSLSLTYNASDGRLDLSGATPPMLSATLNASTVGLTLPSGSFNGSITINASTLKVCAALDLGLRITYDDTLSSQNFAQAGLAQSGKTWQSANYTSATARAELHISANVSTTTLNSVGGCQ